MWDNTIGQQIQRSNRNLFVVNFILLALSLFCFYLSSRYLINLFSGPQKIEESEILSLQDPSKLFRYNVTVTGKTITPVLYTQTHLSFDKDDKVVSETTEGIYQALCFKERALLVSVNQSTKSTTLSGALIPMPTDISSSLVPRLEHDYPPVKGRLLPMMLDTTKFNAFGGSGLLFMLPMLGLALWNLRKVFMRREDYQLHPIAKRLSKYGMAREVAAAIEQEIRLAGNKLWIGTAMLTDSWLLSRLPFDLKIGRLEDAVWIYKKETTQSVNFIPVGKSHALMFNFADKNNIEVSGSGKEMDELLVAVAKKVPWAYFGYSAEVLALWNQNSEAMITAVKKGKSDFSKGSS